VIELRKGKKRKHIFPPQQQAIAPNINSTHTHRLKSQKQNRNQNQKEQQASDNFCIRC
jgi:hypothetical protein